MSITTETQSSLSRTTVAQRRSIANLLAPLNRLAETSPNLLVKSAGKFDHHGEAYDLPRYMFIGPKGGDEPIRIGLFAAIHGDEPAGAYALVQFLTLLERFPELAKGYCLFVYPVCNPTGFEDNTRNSRRGRDLNREFWNNTSEPEVQLLQQELVLHAFHGIVSLHADDTSDGLYGFAHGATLTKHLVEPALKAAEEFLPRNHNSIIDGFNARNGIIRKGYQGILSAPRNTPRPFEIIFETPHAAPQYQQEKAFVVALQAILNEYRKLVAYAPNL
ncbi:MAG TPA: succinylglutamate desuccinylase/aspartoacylase family protein [Verrucomicrobiae bacterium]